MRGWRRALGVGLAAAMGLGCGRIHFQDTTTAPVDGGGADARADAGDAGGASSFCDPAVHAGLVACYPFDGDAMDHSGGSHHPAITAATYEPGTDGQAIRFGASTALVVPEASALDLAIGTIELWIEPDASESGDQNLIDNFPQYELELTSMGRLRARCFIRGSNRTVTGSATVVRDRWTHVALVYDGAELLLYVDGREDASGAYAGTLDTGGTMGTFIGVDHEDATERFSGLLDGLRFFDEPRTAAQICVAAGASGC